MQQDQQANNRGELWNMTIKDLFFKYVRFLPLFIISTALALLGAYVYLRYAQPIYQVSSSLRIKSETPNQRNNDKLEDLISGGSENNLPSEMEVLKSKPLMARVVDSLHLNTSYLAVGKILSPNIYTGAPFYLRVYKIYDSSVSFRIRISFNQDGSFSLLGENKKFRPGDILKNDNFGEYSIESKPGRKITGGTYNILWEPTFVVASRLAQAVSAREKVINTGIVLLTMRHTNPVLARDVLNKLMDEYSIYTVEEKNKTSESQLLFINKRIDSLKAELDQVELKRLNKMNDSRLYDPKIQTERYLLEISDLDKSISQQQALITATEMIRDYLQDKQYKFDPVPSPLGIEDVTLNKLIADYNTAQANRKNLADSKLGPEHPLLKEAESTIEDLRVRLLESLRNVKQLYQTNIASLQNKKQTTGTALGSSSYNFKELSEIETDRDGKLSLFKILLEEREKKSIAKAANIPNSNVIDRALSSSVPVSPNRRAIQILALLLGLGLPALGIFIGEITNDKINTRFDIEKITQGPILGEVGHSFSETSLVVSKTNRSMVAEQFRIIRSNLQFVLSKVDKQVILVTSSFSGEGKSFISTNVAGVMALAGKKTIILEFDIRKPKVLVGLKMSRKPGISNFLVGKSKIEDLPIPVPGYDNLFVLPCGPIPPNPAELLLDEKMDHLFNYLKANFDVVVIDTAPVGMVSDAITLSKFADSTLYIVRQGYTFKKQIILIDELYKEGKMPRISIVINDVKIKPGYGYYGYGRYGYGYGYGEGQGYYQEEDVRKKRTFRSFMRGFFDLSSWDFNFLKRKKNKS